jgi:hypothetical protein
MIRLLGIFLMLVMTVCVATTLLYTVQFGGTNLSPIAFNAAALEKIFDEAPPELLYNQNGETYLSLRCGFGEGLFCDWVSGDSIKTHLRPKGSLSSVIDRDLARQLLIERPDQYQLWPSARYKHLEAAEFNIIRILCRRRADGEKIQCQMHFGYDGEWEPVGIF